MCRFVSFTKLRAFPAVTSSNPDSDSLLLPSEAPGRWTLDTLSESMQSMRPCSFSSQPVFSLLFALGKCYWSFLKFSDYSPCLLHPPTELTQAVSHWLALSGLWFPFGYFYKFHFFVVIFPSLVFGRFVIDYWNNFCDSCFKTWVDNSGVWFISALSLASASPCPRGDCSFLGVTGPWTLDILSALLGNIDSW